MNLYYYKVESHDYKHMQDLFGMTEEYGLLEATFYGQVRNITDFVGLMQDAYLYAVIQDDKVVGYTWLNMFSGSAANSHVCLFPSCENKVQVGKDYIQFVFNAGHITTLIGLVPGTFAHAGNYAHALGYTFMATIPNAITINDEVMDMHLFIITKED